MSATGAGSSSGGPFQLCQLQKCENTTHWVTFYQMSETAFKIKCSKPSSARRFSLFKPTIASLGSHVAASWGASGPSFWYVDDDGDRISVEHDHELQATIAAVQDACVILNVDFNLDTTVDAANQALASSTPKSCHPSDDEDGFITVEQSVVVPQDSLILKSVLTLTPFAQTQEAPAPSTAASASTLDRVPLVTDALEMLVHGDQFPAQDLRARFGQTSAALPLSEQERAEASITIAQLQREIQTLRNALDSTQAQSVRDAEAARQALQSTIEKAEARFEAATAVLSKQLCEAKAALAAAERAAEQKEESRSDAKKELWSSLQRESIVQKQMKTEELAVARKHVADCDDTLTRLTDALEGARQTAHRHSLEIKTLEQQNHGLTSSIAGLQERNQTLASECDQRDVEIKRLRDNLVCVVLEHEQMAAQNQVLQETLDSNEARFQNEASQTETILSELRAHNRLLLEQRSQSTVEPAPAATSPPGPQSPKPRVQSLITENRFVLVAPRAANACAIVVPPSPVSVAPPKQTNWQQIARTVGAPQPSCSDVEKFERAMSVLRSMNLDESDDTRRCVVVNNGDVLAVVDQVLASSA